MSLDASEDDKTPFEGLEDFLDVFEVDVEVDVEVEVDKDRELDCEGLKSSSTVEERERRGLLR